MLIPPVPRRHAVHILKGSRKMQLIFIADGSADIRDGKLGQLQQFRRFCHAVVNQKLLRGFSDCIVKNFSEVAPVEPAGFCNLFYGNIILKIHLYKRKRFLNIEIAHPP